MKAMVKSKLVALFHLLTKNVDECVDENKKIRIPLFLLVKSFITVLFSSEQIYDNLLCLGSVTTLFFVDRDGLLSDVRSIEFNQKGILFVYFYDLLDRYSKQSVDVKFTRRN
jgi:hypothetical protein